MMYFLYSIWKLTLKYMHSYLSAYDRFVALSPYSEQHLCCTVNHTHEVIQHLSAVTDAAHSPFSYF